ncbi:hypothetical protein D3C78_788220 [compost metagenome]
MAFQLGFQAVQSDVRQTGGDDPTLWRPGFRGCELSPVNHPGPQPFPEHHLVHGDVFDEPVVVDVVEEPFDVPFHHPGRSDRRGQQMEEFHHCVSGCPIWPEAITPRVAGAFDDRF